MEQRADLLGATGLDAGSAFRRQARPLLARLSRGEAPAPRAERPRSRGARPAPKSPSPSPSSGSGSSTSLDPESAAYNDERRLRASTERLDLHALERSLHEILRRHEVLRTDLRRRRRASRSRSSTRTWPPSCRSPTSRNLPAGDARGGPRRLADEEARRPFDLAHGPVLRTRCCSAWPAQRALLVLSLSHIVADALVAGRCWCGSWRRSTRPLARGSRRPCPSCRSSTPTSPLWQRGWLAARCWSGSSPTGASRLAGAPPLLELPADRPRPAVQSFRGPPRPIAIPRSESRAPVGASPGARAPPCSWSCSPPSRPSSTRFTGQTTSWSAPRSPTAAGWSSRG